MKMVAHESPVPPRKIDPAIPRDLETIVLKAIAKEPVASLRVGRADGRGPAAVPRRPADPGAADRARSSGSGDGAGATRPWPASLAALFLILSIASAGMTVLWRRAEGQRRRADGLLELVRAAADRGRGEPGGGRSPRAAPRPISPRPAPPWTSC